MLKTISTVVAKNNIEFNTTYSTAINHFRGVSMTAIQSLSHDNIDNKMMQQKDHTYLLKSQIKPVKKL